MSLVNECFVDLKKSSAVYFVKNTNPRGPLHFLDSGHVKYTRRGWVLHLEQ